MTTTYKPITGDDRYTDPDDYRTQEDEDRLAMYGDGDEPCRCGHPESAHTELGCGAPTNYGGGWAIDSPCTCGFYRIEDDPNA